MTETFDTTDPVGRFLVTVLGGVAGLERDNIVQRSTDGTNRLARPGAWLGGVVPYGYLAIGKGKNSPLFVSQKPIPWFPCPGAEGGCTICVLAREEQQICV